MGASVNTFPGIRGHTGLLTHALRRIAAWRWKEIELSEGESICIVSRELICQFRRVGEKYFGLILGVCGKQFLSPPNSRIAGRHLFAGPRGRIQLSWLDYAVPRPDREAMASIALSTGPATRYSGRR